MERKRKKQKTAGGGEGENRYKLSIIQINRLCVGLNAQINFN
jgi:hypothetical protein